MSKKIKQIKQLFKKEKDKKPEISISSSFDVNLDIVNSMHQVMALTVSNIAKLYPKKFDMIKHIITEYGFLIEQVLVFRETGNPQALFNKLSEFVIRSVEGYLEKYEDSEEIIAEEKPVKDLIMDGLIDIQEQIIKKEGLITNEDIITISSVKPEEDWSKKPKITKKGGLPSLNTPIESVKGIGGVTAEKLRKIGVDTLEKYVDYQKAQASKTEDETDNDE